MTKELPHDLFTSDQLFLGDEDRTVFSYDPLLPGTPPDDMPESLVPLWQAFDAEARLNALRGISDPIIDADDEGRRSFDDPGTLQLYVNSLADLRQRSEELGDGYAEMPEQPGTFYREKDGPYVRDLGSNTIVPRDQA